jgi:hypothetical protein
MMIAMCTATEYSRDFKGGGILETTLKPGEDPVGKRLQFGMAQEGNKPAPYQLVGLVGDVKSWRLEGAEGMG